MNKLIDIFQYFANIMRSNEKTLCLLRKDNYKLYNKFIINFDAQMAELQELIVSNKALTFSHRCAYPAESKYLLSLINSYKKGGIFNLIKCNYPNINVNQKSKKK